MPGTENLFYNLIFSQWYLGEILLHCYMVTPFKSPLYVCMHIFQTAPTVVGFYVAFSKVFSVAYNPLYTLLYPALPSSGTAQKQII